MTTFVLKEIKPQKLKVDAILKEIEKALDDEGKYHRKKLEPTVRTWRNKPRFVSEIAASGGSVAVLTEPAGDADAVQHWVWTDQGTKPHPIRARRYPFLQYRKGFIAKTAPKQFSARVGGHVGKWARRVEVNHPGTKPRLWSETLSESRRGPFTKEMIKAMQRGASKAF